MVSYNKVSLDREGFTDVRLMQSHGPCTQKGPDRGLMLCYQRLKVLNTPDGGPFTVTVHWGLHMSSLCL